MYIADTLYHQGRNMVLQSRYYDITHPRPDFDPREVVMRVAAEAGLEVIGK